MQQGGTMLDTESEEWRKRIELRKIDEFQKAMRWFVLVVFLMNWYTWFLLISRHWGEMWNHVAAVGLLSLSPAPCILMFFKREAYPPTAVFFTYILLGLAWGVAVGR
jgi:hypothetical protein